MPIYKTLSSIGKKYNLTSKLFKTVFNLSPMYRRTTAKIIEVSQDLLSVRIRIPISYKNKNYNGSIFGGSLFAAVDPIPMVQLTQLLDANYVVWDKSAEILFKRPAKEDAYATFNFTNSEIEIIIAKVKELKEYIFVKETKLTDKEGEKTFSIVNKTIYIAEKEYYKEKQRLRNSSSQMNH